EKDPRHLWPEMRRIIRAARPRWVIAENVRGHVSLGFDTVAAQLEDDDFTVWPFVVPASAVGAPHRRDRLWNLAHANRGDKYWRSRHEQMGRLQVEGKAQANGYTTGVQWVTEPAVGRVAHGISARMDRLRALGNAVVPQVPELIGRTIIAYEQQLA